MDEATTDKPAMSRRERKKLETRLRILDAAIALMAERSYDDVRIEEIAKAADVANATFFLHFPTKAALVAAFNEQISEKIAERLKGFQLGAVDKLELVRALVLDEWAQHADLLQRIVVDAAAQGGKSFADSSSSLAEVIAGIVRDGQKNGDLSPEFDADIVAQCLVASWRASSLDWAMTGDGDRARRANRQALDLILCGATPRG
ncbi:MAG: TetR family transcriptional regulator [Alphaproteobacteria bacterium]|nr:TetR family transcriptional regulator [Alphaproteobacteria bacterium]